MPIFRGDRGEGQLYTTIIEGDSEKKFLHLRSHTLDSDSVGEKFKMRVNREGDEPIDLLTFMGYNKSRLSWVLAEINELINYWDIDDINSFIIPSQEFMADY